MKASSASRPLCRLALLVALAGAGMAQAQDENPHVGYAYPAGGQQGTTFQVVIGGQHLDGASAARISGKGVQAKVLDHLRPLNQGAFKVVQKQMQDLAQKKEDAAPPGWQGGRRGDSQTFTNAVWTAADEKRLSDLRAKMTTFYIRPSSVPALVETVTLEVAVAPDAATGERELRLQTARGLTNPLVFEIGQLREFTETSGRSVAVAESQDGRRRRRPPEGTVKPMPGTMPVTNAPNAAVTITLPATLNGQILPGDANRYQFRARQGQQLVIAVSARRLIAYLSDAVPGWFQAAVRLLDADGKEVACDGEFRLRPDPVLYYKIRRDGEYTLEIKDALYRGREDFVYRITIGELPFITSIYPLGGNADSDITVELKGWNLPVTHLTHRKGARPGISQLHTCKNNHDSNHAPFQVSDLPECQEREPNDTPETAPSITLPVIINGRIDKPGDRDVFRIEGRAGDSIVAEVFARRLDSPLDSVLKLTDAHGQQIALNDDHEDKGRGLNTHHADSFIRATLPAAGIYYVHIGDVQQQGGPEYAYRLRVSQPQPDFDLRIVPSGINARAGTTVPIAVHVLRRDAFAGDIALALKDAPAGFRLSGARVPAGQDMVRMTLTVPADAPAASRGLCVCGRATIQQREVIHQAVPADDLMQAFVYRHLVPAEESLVCVLGPPQLFTVGPLGAETIKIPLGGQTRLPVNIPASTSWGAVELELSDPPPGITIASVALGQRGGGIVFRSDAKLAKPGLKGNLIVNAIAVRDPATMKGKAQRKKPRHMLTTLPAIPFEIVR